MTKFAFIIHPIDLGYITQNIKLLKVLQVALLKGLFPTSLSIRLLRSRGSNHR